MLAEALERVADTDERLGLLTVTAVDCDPDLRHALVLFASLDDEGEAALGEARVRLQAAISHAGPAEADAAAALRSRPGGRRAAAASRTSCGSWLPQPEAEAGGPTPRTRPVIDGLAVVDKPAGMTSHDVVARCRRLFGQKQVGHAGTLDPDATGVLLVGLGQATRLLQFLTGLPKCYCGRGRPRRRDHHPRRRRRGDRALGQGHVTLEDARRAAASSTGTIWQIPPMVSAVKVGGRRLHQLARQGVEVDRARPAGHRLALRRGVPGRRCRLDVGVRSLAVRVECSSGTYVRVLAADLGAALGGGAHLRRLRRTAVGPWTDRLSRPAG